MGFSIVNHPFWATPSFGNTYILLRKKTCVLLEISLGPWVQACVGEDGGFISEAHQLSIIISPSDGKSSSHATRRYIALRKYLVALPVAGESVCRTVRTPC